MKILLIDDDEVDRLAIRRALSKMPQKMQIEEAHDLASGVNALRTMHIDCILVDYILPDGDGASFAQAVNRQDNPPPVIVLTGQGDRKADLAAMKAGAAEYIEKDALSADILDRAIRYALENNSLIRRLRETNEQLKELDRLKNEFLSTASHELRTPLTIIREFVALVRDEVTGPVNDEQKDCLESALNNCDRLGSIINDLLDLQRIESGKLKLARRKNDISALIRRCINDFVRTCEKKKQVLTYSGDDRLPMVLCDEGKITQVLVNLIGNAYKFTEPGGEISIRTRLVADRIEVEVTDTGMGISPEDQARIFEKFTQINRNAGPGKKGTGLGLAITQRIMKLHESDISVRSEEGKGSTFFFSLPVYREKEELRAFVMDHAFNINERDKAWTLLLLTEESALPDRARLDRTESLVKRTLRCDEDCVLTIESMRTVTILVQADISGGMSLLNRLFPALHSEFNDTASFSYTLAPVLDDTVEAFCESLEKQEKIHVDLTQYQVQVALL
ncbi:MAG: hybrid sensor histidine kinase/response regulator [Planctomycetota bacterium]